MNKTITLEFPEKKLEALSHFLAKKDTTVDTELIYSLGRLYERHVPPTVREFLDDSPPERKPVPPVAPRVALCAEFLPRVGKVPIPAQKRPVWAPCAEPSQRLAP